MPTTKRVRIIKKVRQASGLWRFISLARIRDRYIWDKRPGYYLSSGGKGRNGSANLPATRQARQPKPNAASATNF